MDPVTQTGWFRNYLLSGFIMLTTTEMKDRQIEYEWGLLARGMLGEESEREGVGQAKQMATKNYIVALIKSQIMHDRCPETGTARWSYLMLIM